MTAVTEKRRRAILVGIGVLVLAAVASAIWITRPWQPSSSSSSSDASAEAAENSEIVTVPVEYAALTQQIRLNASLGFGEPVKLAPAAGILTRLPAPGAIVHLGEPVFEIEGRPVVLFEGARPLWRELTSEMKDGPDVLQVEQNLEQLGYFTAEPDEHFDWWTKDAIVRWQKKLGLEATGSLQPADVVVVNAASIRISQVTASLGEKEASPLSYTTTTLQAKAKLTAAQARQLQAGTEVLVVLPDGTELKNTIAAVDPGGEPTEKQGETTPPVALIEFPDQNEVAATGPANVRVIVQRGQDAAETLVVPVTALIATAQDHFAVEVRTSESIVRVPVEIGLVADARVQITGSGAEVEGAPSDARMLEVGDEVVISR